MRYRIDLTGQQFGKLKVLHLVKNYTPRTWVCVCACGGFAKVQTKYLLSGNNKSCGCRPRLCGTPTHTSWKAMMIRCNVPTASNYPRYGGSGITVCERWRSYKNFLSDMGERPENKTLDRKDNKLGYEPTNCKWSTSAEQAQNKKYYGDKVSAFHKGRKRSALTCLRISIGRKRSGDLRKGNI